MSRKNKPSHQVLPSDSQLFRVVNQVFRQHYYQGPMPHPDIMKKYEELKPWMIDFFLNEVKKQTDHRIELENNVAQSNISNEKRGSWFAFIIAIIALLGGFTLIGLGKTGVGIFVSLGTLFSLAAVFISGKIVNIKNILDKKNNLLNKDKDLNKD